MRGTLRSTGKTRWPHSPALLTAGFSASPLLPSPLFSNVQMASVKQEVSLESVEADLTRYD